MSSDKQQFNELQQFFAAFSAAFPTFDGQRIAERYDAPYLALNADGGLRSLATQQDIAAYFQTHLDRYRAQGCVRCEFCDLAYLPMGSQSVLASVTWQLWREDGVLLSQWRESYNLHRVCGCWLIYASTDHVA